MAARGSPVAARHGRFTRPLDAGVEPAAVVGRRGAALAHMSSLGLPVPPSFAITVDAFRAWRSAGETTPPEVWREVRERLAELAAPHGDGSGLRSFGVRASRPEPPAQVGDAAVQEQAIVDDAGGPASAPAQPLRRAIESVWHRTAGEPSGAGHGPTALVVQRVVPHRPAASSGRGLIVSRDPVTGSPGAVVTFSRDGPADLRHDLPEVHEALENAAVLLETAFRDMCAIEFAVDRGELWLLDAYTPQRSGRAAIRVAVDMIDQAFVDVAAALPRIPLWALEQAQAPVFARGQELEVVARGLPVAPGAAAGAAVFDRHEADERAAAGEPFVLLAPAAAVDEAVAQWHSSAVVLAGPAPLAPPPGAFAKRPAVCHVPDLEIEPGRGRARAAGGQVLRTGDRVSVDGRQGVVAAGDARLVAVQPEPHVARVLRWCDERRRTAIAEASPAGWRRVRTLRAARSVHGARALIDPSAEDDPDARTRRLRELLAAALDTGVSEVGLVLPDPLGGWDPQPPAAPWRLTLAPPGLSWAARLLAARVPRT